MKQKDRRKRTRVKRLGQKWRKGLKRQQPDRNDHTPKRKSTFYRKLERTVVNTERVRNRTLNICMGVQPVALLLWLVLSWPYDADSAAVAGLALAVPAWTTMVVVMLVTRAYGASKRAYAGAFIMLGAGITAMGLGLLSHWVIGVVAGFVQVVAGAFIVPGEGE